MTTMDIGNKLRKLGKVWTSGSRDMLVDRHANRQTDRQTD